MIAHVQVFVVLWLAFAGGLFVFIGAMLYSIASRAVTRREALAHLKEHLPVNNGEVDDCDDCAEAFALILADEGDETCKA